MSQIPQSRKQTPYIIDGREMTADEMREWILDNTRQMWQPPGAAPWTEQEANTMRVLALTGLKALEHPGDFAIPSEKTATGVTVSAETWDGARANPPSERTMVCVSDEQLLKTYDDARYGAACPVSGTGTDGHIEGLRAIVEACGARPSTEDTALRERIELAQRNQTLERCALICEDQIKVDEAHGRLQSRSILSRAAVSIRAIKTEPSTPPTTAPTAGDDYKHMVDAWVGSARDLARELGLPDDESKGSTHDWRYICERAKRSTARDTSDPYRLAFILLLAQAFQSGWFQRGGDTWTRVRDLLERVQLPDQSIEQTLEAALALECAAPSAIEGSSK